MMRLAWWCYFWPEQVGLSLVLDAVIYLLLTFFFLLMVRYYGDKSERFPEGRA
ncbi:MAG: hypothetical protein GY841_13085 [FCB group bacterium]|nr:hypothetical protein [FCB group bacterium]